MRSDAPAYPEAIVAHTRPERVGIEWGITHLLDRAEARAARTPELDRSMRGSEANEVGALGELVAIDYLEGLGIKVTEVGDTRCDLRTPFGTIDVKTKERSVRPLAHYEATVPDYNHDHQIPDYYLFVSLLGTKGIAGVRRFASAYVLGSISRSRFDQLATLWRAGQIDPSNGWKVEIDCWNVAIRDLTPPKASNERMFA